MDFEKKEKIFKLFLKVGSFLSIVILACIVIFIIRECFPFFKEISLEEMFGSKWKPYSEHALFGMRNFILSTLYISFLSLCMAIPIGIGGALFISCVIKEEIREFVKFYITILAGIPSIIYGFIGLITIVKFFEKCGRASGESVFSGAIILSIMILPYLTNSCEEKMHILKKSYMASAKVLGTDKWYLIRKVILPASKKAIFISIILSLGRALGETMAVMMVIGNAPIFPRFFGKAETLSSLIALEMGGAEVGSMHYHALFVAGFLLIFFILILNIFIYFTKRFLGEANG